MGESDGVEDTEAVAFTDAAPETLVTPLLLAEFKLLGLALTLDVPPTGLTVAGSGVLLPAPGVAVRVA